MIKIKVIYFLLLFAVFAICLDVHTGRSAENSDNPFYEEKDGIEALAWGFKFASAIPAKPHIVDRSKSQYSVLSCYLEKDLPDRAVESVVRIDDWRRCLLYADLAYYFAESGANEKAGVYLNRAEECRGSLDGWNAGWQKDRVLLRMAEARAISGQWVAVEKSEAELPPELVERSSVTRFSRLNESADYEKRLSQLQPLEESQNLEVKRDVALAYTAILKQLGDTATLTQCNTLKTRIYKIIEQLPLLLQHDILCSFSRAAFDAGHGDMGRDILGDAAERIKLRKPDVRHDVAALSDLARIWHVSAGDSKHSASLLTEAETLMAKSTLKSTDRVAPLVSLALAHGVRGDEKVAWNYFSEALHSAESQVNSRPRAMAITKICNGIARWGAPMAKDIEKELKRLYEGLGNPW